MAILSDTTIFRAITGLSESDISDSEVLALQNYAQQLVLREISVSKIREEVNYIDEARQNKIDGSNTTFYVSVSNKGYYISDMDWDGDVTTSDVKVHVVYNQTETEYTVSSVSPAEGKIVLSTAPPTGSKVYITYNYTFVSVTPPDNLLQLAVANLAAAFAYARLNTGKAKKMKFGNMQLERDLSAFDHYYMRYREIVSAIISKGIILSGQSTVSI